MRTFELNKDLTWVGIEDKYLRVFDIIMESPYGTTYNSYVLKGSEKVALFETAKATFADEYIAKVQEIVDIKDIDYIIVDHTEPDHSGTIEKLLTLNPFITVVGSAVAINFLKDIVNHDFLSLIVKDKDTLSLGNKTLQFYMLPNLHWPDTMYTYCIEDQVLFTCDSFGSHYATEDILYSKLTQLDHFRDAYKYYYDCILGPFGHYVLKALDVMDTLDVRLICNGHGPLIDQDIEEFKNLYREWATPVKNEVPLVVIPYVSAYGYTRQIKDEIIKGIKASGTIEVHDYDMVVSDAAKVTAELFKADGMLFGTPTIVGEALKPIYDLTTSLFPVMVGGKLAGAFGSYGWSGEGVPHITERLRQLHLNVVDGLRVKFKPGESDLINAYEYGYRFGSLLLKKPEVVKNKTVKKVKCLVCGAIFGSDVEVCPVCGVDSSNFIPWDVAEVTFQKNTNETFLVLGNGVAGFEAARAIRERNKTCQIELISEEHYLAYNRPMLTKGLLGTLDPKQIAIENAAWYSEHQIKETLGVKVTSIDRNQKVVTLDNGVKKSYDKLIYALGSTNFIPPMPGTTLPNVISIRNLEDVKTIRHLLPVVEKAVVIGGGVLGLEAAWELRKAGKEVTILEALPRIMPRQLDDHASKMMEKIIEKTGITLHTGVKIEAIEGDERAHLVKVSELGDFEAQLVIVSTGVRANATLAKECGLEVNRGVIVNAQMETSDPSIYAAGDCAEYQGVNYAIWPEALEQGKVAGATAAGDEATYHEVNAAITFNGMETQLYAIGDTGKNVDGSYRVVELMDQKRNTYEKYYFENDQIVGAILIGDTSKMAKVDQAITEKQSFLSFMK